jgi:hypothetical protein
MASRKRRIMNEQKAKGRTNLQMEDVKKSIVSDRSTRRGPKTGGTPIRVAGKPRKPKKK